MLAIMPALYSINGLSKKVLALDCDNDLLPARVTMTSERFPIRLDEGRSLYEG